MGDPSSLPLRSAGLPMRTTAEYLWDNGRAGRCQLEWSDRPPWHLRVEIPGNPAVDVVGQDLFDCLCAARRIMEPSGIRICVNGARQNSWPSRMGSEMGGAGFVYMHKLGKPGHPSDKVPVLTDAPVMRSPHSQSSGTSDGGGLKA